MKWGIYMYPQNTCLESDWKLFRKRVPVWQERYMGRLMEEYRAILESEESSSEKSWALEKRIRQDKKPWRYSRYAQEYHAA